MAGTDRKTSTEPVSHRDVPEDERPDPRDLAPGPVRYWRWSLVGFAVLIALVAILSIT